MPPDSPRNIVLLCLDSVRKDYFDRYAPRLQEATDVSFTQCRAASSWSTPSHASMFTGSLPSEHGVHTHDRSYTSISREDTFLDKLDEYTTIGTSANVFVSGAYEFDRLFDQFDEIAPACRDPEGLDPREFVRQCPSNGFEQYVRYFAAALKHKNPRRSLSNGFLKEIHQLTRTGRLPKFPDDGATAVFRAAKCRIKHTAEPYFAFLNVMDAHTPHQHVLGYDRDLHDAPNTWTSTKKSVWELVDRSRDHTDYWKIRRALTGAAVDYLDRKTMTFIDEIVHESDTETTVIITADHGDNLGGETDEFLANHKSSLSEGLLHVPLAIINPPHGFDSPGNEYVSHLDLGRLIVGLANNTIPDITRNRAPAELIGMSSGPEPPDEYDYEEWDRMIRCLYEGTSKITWDSQGNRTAYEIDMDRANWQQEISGDVDIPASASSFFETPITEYKRQARRAQRSESIDSATANRLEELGYL